LTGVIDRAIKRAVTDKKIGHREVKDGVVHYKKVPTDELKKSISIADLAEGVYNLRFYSNGGIISKRFVAIKSKICPSPTKILVLNPS
jgi:hypothetical protein